MSGAVIEQFASAIRASGISPPSEIHADGELHRFASNGKQHDDAGWYVLHSDGVAAGAFGNWRSGESQTWRANIGRKLSPVEAAALSERTKQDKRKRDAEEARGHACAATAAAKLLAAAEQAPDDHYYLARKGIKPHGVKVYRGNRIIGGMNCDGALMIPLRDINKVTHNIQFIAPNGKKRFLPGGRKRGLYCGLAGNVDGGVLLCEGFATGASLFEATGQSTLVAFDAGNLEQVARVVRDAKPNLPITVCADDDHRTAGNPGLAKATEAARAVGGVVALPEFGEDRLDGATDFNDMMAHRGAGAVKQAVANAKAAAVELEGPVIEFVRADTITPEPIKWVWDGFLAGGKLHIVAGAPGTGKTTLALAIAATITTGGRWPDGTRASTGDVLIWSGEDSASDTLVPRLIAAGADRTRIHIVRDVRDGSDRRPFDPAVDFPDLAVAAARIPDLRLMIVDPIVSAVAGDSHKNSETRRALQPLVDFAERSGCAILGVSHFSKGTQGRDPVERVTGSLAFGAVARVVLGTAKLRDDEGGGRALVRAKSNIGPDGGGFRYELRQDSLSGEAAGIVASRVEWSSALSGTAQAILAAAEQETAPDERSAIADAVDFLRAELADGPKPAREVQRISAQAGHAGATLRRAKQDLRVQSVKADGPNGAWMWLLPTNKVLKPVEDAQDAQGVQVGKDEHLDAHVDAPIEQGAHEQNQDAHPKTLSTLSTFVGNEHVAQQPASPDEESFE
jgi:putative DNA primase/helicase